MHQNKEERTTKDPRGKVNGRSKGWVLIFKLSNMMAAFNEEKGISFSFFGALH